MKQHNLTISITLANILGLILLLLITVIVGFLWYILYGYPSINDINYFLSLFPQQHFNPYLPALAIFFCLIGGIIVHELIHGIAFSLYTKHKWKSIRFGIKWEMLTPYCHCKEPLIKKQYIIGALAPLIILGIIPLLFGFIFRDIMLIIWGIIFVVSAIGDILIVWKLRKYPSDIMVLDHPTEAGCIIYDHPSKP